jgi:hypothetical protein
MLGAAKTHPGETQSEKHDLPSFGASYPADFPIFRALMGWLCLLPRLPCRLTLPNLTIC